MSKTIHKVALTAGLFALTSLPAHAGLLTSSILTYAGPSSIGSAVAGVNAGILAAPSSVADLSPGLESPFMVGFNRRFHATWKRSAWRVYESHPIADTPAPRSWPTTCEDS